MLNVAGKITIASDPRDEVTRNGRRITKFKAAHPKMVQGKTVTQYSEFAMVCTDAQRQLIQTGNALNLIEASVREHVWQEQESGNWNRLTSFWVSRWELVSVAQAHEPSVRLNDLGSMLQQAGLSGTAADELVLRLAEMQAKQRIDRKVTAQ